MHRQSLTWNLFKWWFPLISESPFFLGSKISGSMLNFRSLLDRPPWPSKEKKEKAKAAATKPVAKAADKASRRSFLGLGVPKGFQ